MSRHKKGVYALCPWHAESGKFTIDQGIATMNAYVMCMYHLLKQVGMYISAWVRVARSIYWVTRTLRAERQTMSPALFLL